MFWDMRLRRVFILLIFSGASLLFPSDRECPENFTANSQYPASGSECFPSEFVFYSSTSIAYYYYLSATINDTPIASGSSNDALKTMELVYGIYCADPIWKKKWNITL